MEMNLALIDLRARRAAAVSFLALFSTGGFAVFGCALPKPWPASPLYETPANDPAWQPPADEAAAMSAIVGHYAHFDVVAYEGVTPNGPLATFITSYGFTDFTIEDGELVEKDCFCRAEYNANQDFDTVFPDAATQAIRPRSAAVNLTFEDGAWRIFRPATPSLIGIDGDPNQPLSTTSDAFLFVENVDPDLLNQRVWVTGCLNPQSTICLPPGGPAVEDNTIGECIELCGRVIQGPECILFRGDDDVTYYVPNVGLGLVGKRLRITGCRGPEITPCSIDLPFPSILDSINELLGDMNCDGVVSVSDIGPFVTAITNPALYQQLFPNCEITLADMNCDGVVTVGDIGLFVRVLTNATDPPGGG